MKDVIYVDDNNDNGKELLKQISNLKENLERVRCELCNVCDYFVECGNDITDMQECMNEFEKLSADMNHVLSRVQSKRLEKLHDELWNWHDVL